MKKFLISAGIALLIAAPLAAQGTDDASKGKRGRNFDGGMESLVQSLPQEEISAAERQALRFMREEEKLARDVYLTLFDEWSMPIFKNISVSEQRHMDAVKNLLDKYGIPDPVSSDIRGYFVNPDLQQLYIDLTEAGRESLLKALWVGASIEELDIRDLQVRLAKADNLDIRLVFQNLMKGSRNHLRSFVSKYTARGGVYEAQYLDPAEVEEIISSPIERGLVDENSDPIYGPYGW